MFKRLMWRLPFLMSCEELERFIYDYLEGCLPESVKAKFEFHLKLCAECRHYLAAYRRTIDVGRSAIERDVPPQMPEDLVKAIMDARKGY